ncbi:hypothetical protein TIFTF001_043150 [Ficus carica]|uniref:Uncharacterized protein n=1 Tax=Ficus carica TaxID=3494 RepID=A0AA87YZ65_FICCA|nr:hypothetical protein TIFTF001_043150 [Ficus carica]
MWPNFLRKISSLKNVFSFEGRRLIIFSTRYIGIEKVGSRLRKALPVAWIHRTCAHTHSETWNSRIIEKTRWSNALVIPESKNKGVSRRLECLGDPDGLNSECSRRVDMLQVYRCLTSNGLTLRVPLAAGAGNRTGTVAGSIRCQAAGTACRAKVLLLVGTGRHDVGNEGPTAQAGLSSCPRSATRVGPTSLDYSPLRVHSGEQQHSGDGDRSIRFPGEHFRTLCLIWSDVHGHQLFSTVSWK